MLGEEFNFDRKFLERKYHNPDEPFNPYARMAYHGWKADESTGLSVDEIKSGLMEVARKYADCSHEVQKARAVEFVLDNTRVGLSEHDYFPLIYTWNREIRATTVDRWNEEVFGKILPPSVRKTQELSDSSGAVSQWPDFDHVVPDWDALLKLGFTGLLSRANAYREALSKRGLSESQKAYFDGIEIEYTAIIRFVGRLAEYARTKKFGKAKRIAECLTNLSGGAPKNIYEAMMLIYLYFMISESVDHYQVRSLGNGLDFTLKSFYDNDLKSGTFTRDEIKELLAYFMMQWSAIGNYWGQPMYLGGTYDNGKTKINDLSRDIISVYSELGIYNPKIQIKYGDSVPADFLNKILIDIRKNRGSYVFVSEKGMIKAIMSYGVSYEEARDFDIRGCYESGVRGNEVSSTAAYINVLKAVEFVFSDGFDYRTKQQVGVKTGDVTEFKSFADFYGAYIAQLNYLIDGSVRLADEFEKYFSYINPSSLYSATIEHSLERGEDAYQSGVKYNNSSVLCCGFASAVDSLLAVKDLVFDRRETTLSELDAALKADWIGYDGLRLKAKNSKLKFGNGNAEADAFAETLARYFAMRIGNKPNARGGVYKPIMHTAMQFVWQGEKTGATPDGRKAGEEMSKNGSPSPGADREGVTALVSSVLKTNPTLFTESFCLDVMLLPSSVSGDDGLKAMKALLDVYDRGGGMSLQFNIFDPEMLSDARKNPEKYKNLQVRVCGWNVLWNNLSHKEQEAYIMRARNIR